MKLNIQVGNNNEILRKESIEISKKDFQKFAKIAESMIKFIKNPKNNGIGIAAPQIGLNYRLICVSLLKDYEDTNYKTIYMINPEILFLSEQCDIDNEGCLSVPGFFGDVKRSSTIKVRYFDGKGKEFILNLAGIPARIVQHEIDHLNGILFTDKIINTVE